MVTALGERFKVGYPKTEPNPDTWVRGAWERATAAGIEILGQENPPPGLTETDWYIVRRHVLNGHPFAAIARSFSEPASRIQEFAEAATRAVIPEFSIGAMAEAIGGDAVEAAGRVAIFTGAENLYRALGSPLGEDPGAVGQFFQAIAQNAGIVQAIRESLDANVIEMADLGSPIAVTSATPARPPEEN